MMGVFKQGSTTDGSLPTQNNEGTRYLYTGQEYDIESDLYYYNARYYNPAIGRFLSRDPVWGSAGNVLSKNPYIYVQNNPLKFVDPTGMMASWQQINSYVRKELNNLLTGIKQFGGGAKAEVKSTVNKVAHTLYRQGRQWQMISLRS